MNVILDFLYGYIMETGSRVMNHVYSYLWLYTVFAIVAIIVVLVIFSSIPKGCLR